MKYRQLGNSGLVVSELALGTMTFGTHQSAQSGLKLTLDQSAAKRLVEEAIDQGINFFNTADLYAAGESETILGQALGKKRHSVLIATKAYFRSGAAIFKAGNGFKHLVEQCEASLKRLGTDYLDVLLAHNEDSLAPVGETLRAFENLVQRGLVRYVGFSNHSAWKAATMLQMQKSRNYHPFVASEMHYSLLNREVEREFIPMSLHHGVGLMAWSPLSGGFLTGKYSKENPAPAEGRLTDYPFGKMLFDTEKGYAVVEKLKAMAEKHRTTPTAVAIAWLLSRPAVATVIIGVSKREQLESNLAGSALTLSRAELEELSALTAPVVRYPQTFAALQDGERAAAKRFH